MKLFFLGGCLTASLWNLPFATAETNGEAFFETHIRPTLIESCIDCHGPEKQHSGLRLDTLKGWLKGSDYHTVVVPGKPEESTLLDAIRHVGELKMPKDGAKLSEDKIAHFEEWIQMGLPWPERPEIAGEDTKNVEEHWAFLPIEKPPLPEDAEPGLAPLDALVTSAQKERGLARNPQADRPTLIRRAYLDLLGYPPTSEQVNAFVADASPNAYERLIDELLASPHYGERWGRYWLDVARYADSKGYVFEEERRYPYAFTYRDWVVDSFNTDLPYEQFLVHQMAGDQVATEEDPTPMAGLGFLTLGRRFLNQQPDIIDDRIDVVTRGTMGLTVACARCHDHKFDPIPTADYYSLYGVFASSEEPNELPLLGEPEDSPEYRAFQTELDAREAKLENFFTEKHAALRTEETIKNYLTLVFEGWDWEDTEFSSQAQNRDLYQKIAHDWRRFIKDAVKDSDPVFQPWAEFASLESTDFQDQCAPLLNRIAATAHPGLTQVFLKENPTSMDDVIAVYARELAGANQNEAFEDPNRESLRQILVSPESPTGLEPDKLYRIFNTPDQQHVRRLRREIEEHKALSPGAPPRAMAMQDRENPVDPHIFVRGDARRPGEKVPRQFLEILSGPDREPFEQGSGRLEMAQAIASADNPLTARVFVNRVWDHHFGASLVESPSDFGVRTPEPVLADVLDYLASEFIDNGWSVKRLHRLMMLSEVYQQTSDSREAAEAIDPTNDLYWKMNRRRLDLEAFRDSLLYVSDRLDLRVGGRAVDIVDDPGNRRRSIYGFIDRQNLPSLFRTFDFASPDAHSPQRFETTVPQQALFMMNSPFIKIQIDALLQDPNFQRSAQESAANGVRSLYQQVLSRLPSPDEEKLGTAFIEQGGEEHDPWASLAQVLLSSNEFVFID